MPSLVQEEIQLLREQLNEIQQLQERLNRIEAMTVGSNEWKKRQTEGIAAAKARGTHFGRRRIEMPQGFETLLAQWNNREITAESAAKQLGISRKTFLRRAREYNASVESTSNTASTASATPR